MLGHYLMFNRTCADALAAYAEIFGVPVQDQQRYGDMPPSPDFPVAEADKDLVLHSRLVIDGGEIMGADSTGRHQIGSNMYVTVTTKDADLVTNAWAALEVDGEVYMPLTPTFFSLGHGSLRDRFGVNWMFTILAE